MRVLLIDQTKIHCTMLNNAHNQAGMQNHYTIHTVGLMSLIRSYIVNVLLVIRVQLCLEYAVQI